LRIRFDVYSGCQCEDVNAFFGLSRGLSALGNLKALKLFITSIRRLFVLFYRFMEISTANRVSMRSAYWELLGQVVACMPLLQELDLSRKLATLIFSCCFTCMADQRINDERFLAIAEGVTSLGMLKKLSLQGDSCSSPQFSLLMNVTRLHVEQVISAKMGSAERDPLAFAEERLVAKICNYLVFFALLPNHQAGHAFKPSCC
jgi:hypothetical protein